MTKEKLNQLRNDKELLSQLDEMLPYHIMGKNGWELQPWAEFLEQDMLDTNRLLLLEGFI